jgi:hypothetical protein
MFSPGAVMSIVGMFSMIWAAYKSFLFQMGDGLDLRDFYMIRFHMISGLFLFVGGLTIVKMIKV